MEIADLSRRKAEVDGRLRPGRAGGRGAGARRAGRRGGEGRIPYRGGPHPVRPAQSSWRRRWGRRGGPPRTWEMNQNDAPKPFRWDSRKETAAALLAEDHLTDEQIAAASGCSRAGTSAISRPRRAPGRGRPVSITAPNASGLKEGSDDDDGRGHSATRRLQRTMVAPPDRGGICTTSSPTTATRLTTRRGRRRWGGCGWPPGGWPSWRPRRGRASATTSTACWRC